jgi:hypothetical protein
MSRSIFHSLGNDSDDDTPESSPRKASLASSCRPNATSA